MNRKEDYSNDFDLILRGNYLQNQNESSTKSVYMLNLTDIKGAV